MNNIILKDGSRMAVSHWQAENKLAATNVSQYFKTSEIDCNGHFEIAEPLLYLIDEFRKRKGKPVTLNSGYRSQEKQLQLKNQGYKTAAFSPHCYGMAVDIETKTRQETLEGVKLLQRIALDFGYTIRLGYSQYLNAGQTFIHVDVCPEFYAPGKPFHKQQHPWQWEMEVLW